MSREAASTTRRSADVDFCEPHHAPRVIAKPPRPIRYSRNERPRNAKQIALSAHESRPSAQHVIDDLPDVVPVGAQELDAIETYLGAVLNALLGARERDGREKPVELEGGADRLVLASPLSAATMEQDRGSQ
jgi:hypothetical protein